MIKHLTAVELVFMRHGGRQQLYDNRAGRAPAPSVVDVQSLVSNRAMISNVSMYNGAIIASEMPMIATML